MVKEFVMIEKNRKGQLTIQGRLDTRLHMTARHGMSECLVKYLGGQDSASMRKGVVHLSNGINHMYDATRPFRPVIVNLLLKLYYFRYIYA
jgi:hypothetical protein